MSELDRFLGPKRPATVAHSRTPTDWGDAPAALRPLLDRFQELTGWQFTKQERRKHVALAGQYYEVVRTSDPDLLERAFRDLEQSGMTIKSVKSMMNTARFMLRKREDWDSEEARQEYAKGWDFDDDN